MFDISKYKKSNVKISIRLPENINDILKLIAKKEKMSFNNVIVSCIQNSLDQLDLDAYFNGSDDSKKTDGTNQNKNKNQGKDNKNNINKIFVFDKFIIINHPFLYKIIFCTINFNTKKHKKQHYLWKK